MLRLLAAAALAIIAGHGWAQRWEVSDDGRLAARIADQAEARALHRGDGLFPYADAPDWQNDFRIQIGGLVAADMNGDGLTDIVVGCYNSPSFPPYDNWRNFIYFNTGGQLEANPSWTSDDMVSTGDIKVADINGDDFPDIFAANGGTAFSPSVIYFGSAAGVATAPGWSSQDNAWNNFALPVDVDKDGDLDVVTANQGRDQFDPHRPMFLFLNDNGALATAPSWQSQETSIQNFLAAGDWDGDTWVDIAVSKWSGFESGVYRNLNGVLATTPVWTTGDGGTDRGVAWADVDDNGDVDFALGHSPTQLFNNDNGALTLSWSSTAAFFGQQDFRFADVDGDGDPDLAEINFSNGHVNIYLNQDGVLETAPAWTFDSPGAGTAIAFGDIDGNGSLDLIVGNSGQPSLFVFYSQVRGNALFADGFESGDLSRWSRVQGSLARPRQDR